MNEQKFDGKGAVYTSARPSYPQKLFSLLCGRNILNSHVTAADIGAGTGIFTRSLSGYAEKVFAVEPNGDMRGEGEKQAALNTVFVDGNAENTSLPDNCVDVVTAAQAFHWFNGELFKKECGRIFRENSDRYVVLVWNDRDESSPLIKANFEVNRRFCPLFKGASNGENIEDGVSAFFTNGYEKAEFENPVFYSEEMFLRRCFSSSYASKPGDFSFDGYGNALREVFAEFSEDGTAKYPYITRCYFGKI